MSNSSALDRPRASLRAVARTALAALLVAAGVLVLPAAATALPQPANDPFYAYTGETPLAQIAPGTVVKTRTKPFHVSGLATPLKAVQLLYRSTSQLGRPTVNVTSVVLPPVKRATPRLLAYQSFYDSLNPADQPSFSIAGGTTFGGAINTVEVAFYLPFLLEGYTVTIPDTQGQSANFAAGPEYGMNTLDGIRATYNSPLTGIRPDTKTAMYGYSGGAIATGWAAELAPEYAPDVNGKLVGATYGGVLVSPAHNLHYIEGSQIWAGVAAMAIVGAARSFEIDLEPYLSPYGRKIYNQMKKASIANVLGAYPGLTWKQMAKPEFPTAESVPIYVKTVNKLIMGTYGTPTIPLFIGQGARGELEGTKGNKPGIGKGDGVMIAGDVRTLARQFCDAGVKVQYREYGSLSHTGAMLAWLPSAKAWIKARFGGAPAPENCASIAPGNSLAPLPEDGTAAG